MSQTDIVCRSPKKSPQILGFCFSPIASDLFRIYTALEQNGDGDPEIHALDVLSGGNEWTVKGKERNMGCL